MKRLLFLFLAGAASLNVAAVSEIPVSLNSSQYAVVTNNAGPLRDFTLSGITAYDGAAQVEFACVSNRPYATASSAVAGLPSGAYTHQLSTFNAWTGTRTYSYRVQIAQPDGTGDIYARITAVTISREGVNLVDHPDIRNLVRDSALIEFAYTGTDPELAGYSVTSLRLGAVPYIESLGTSGFSTGYRMKGGVSRVEVDFALTTTENSAQTWAFGTDANENTLRTFMYFTGSGVGSTFMFRVRGGDNVNVGATDPNLTAKTGDRGWNHAADTDRHVLIVDLKNGRDQIMTDGAFSMNQAFDPNLLTNLTADLPLSLFARYGNNRATKFERFCKAKIYGVKIYENDELVRNFVPCKKEGVTPCFKDLVEGGFIVPEDAAAFSASDDAPTYQDNAYVSTAANANGGKLYIDTGYVIGDNTCVALDCAMEGDLMNGEYTSSTLWYLFDGTPSSGQRFEVNFGALSNVGCLRWSAAGTDFYATTNWWRAAFQPATAANDFRKLRRTYILGGSGGNVRAAVTTCGFTNCTVTVSASTTYSGSTTLKIASYFSGTSYNTPLRIYGCKIYESGELVRDFVPYVGRDYATGTATPGLRDSITGKFAVGKDGANVGNLLAYGGTIEGEQDAYIESNGENNSAISTGYKMKGACSRVEVEFSFVTPAGQKYIYGSGVDSVLQTFLYITGSGIGDSFKFCQRPYTNNGCDTQWCTTVEDGPDTDRHLAVTDLKNKKNIFDPYPKYPLNNSYKVTTRSFSSDFSGKTAALPLTIFGRFSSADGTAMNNCANARIYSVRFYENYVEGGNNTPVRELIPYKNGSVVGFYDTVTGETVKNDNAAAGAFTFGGAGMDHGELNCYVKPGYVTKISYGHSTTLTAYAPGAVSYRWLCDGEPIYGGTDGTLTVSWARGGTRMDDGYLHTYQAIAVFNMYGATRESSPSAAAEIKCRFVGTTITIR